MSALGRPGGPPGEGGIPGRILIIDDDPAGREVAHFYLRKVEYEVTVAQDELARLSALLRPPSISLWGSGTQAPRK